MRLKQGGRPEAGRIIEVAIYLYFMAPCDFGLLFYSIWWIDKSKKGCIICLRKPAEPMSIACDAYAQHGGCFVL